MNRSKRSMPANVRKKMEKTIRALQTGKPTIEPRRKSDAEVAREQGRAMRIGRGKEYVDSLQSIKKKIHIKKVQSKKNTSKRTTPGEVDGFDSTPAYPHKEGRRWIKTTIKQNLSDRKIQDRRGQKSGKKV